ncbi:hypothetical protein [Streptomyces fulvoviolaceus]|uniref:hypothetical protein n=1 Tax=Streptomyces fulvoviolaceus TaxID=285535 RepID=UPI000A97C56F|nr:hypothetical protein [Streptomyces fulvoviolaceus]
MKGHTDGQGACESRKHAHNCSAGRTPPLYLRPGQTLVSQVEGIGQLTQTFTEKG